MLIFTTYKEPKEKRGTLMGGIFYRDNTPLVWNRFISLEPDVVTKLEEYGCKEMQFVLRGGEKIVTTVEKFKDSMTRVVGTPNKRKQYLFDAKPKKKDVPWL